MKFYANGPYKVQINTDGSVKVAAGDWLSKYSAAIHNDFLHIYEYGRKGPAGNIEAIKDVDRIVAGETLYHLPTLNAKPQPTHNTVAPQVPQVTLTAVQKKKIIEATLQNDFNLKGEHLNILSSATDIIGWTDNALTLAEMAGLLAKAPVISQAGAAFGIISTLLFPVGTFISFVNASESGLKIYGMRAVAYTITAWAFDGPVPTSSKRCISNVSYGYHRDKLLSFEKAWASASSETKTKLNAQIRKWRVGKNTMKILLQACGDHNKQKLCLMLLKGFEKEFSGPPLITWKHNYEILYPE